MAGRRLLHARYRWGFGTLLDPDKSSIQNIALPCATRRRLLAIIRASQGGELGLRDYFRTDIELVRGVWSQLSHSPIWEWGILLDNERGWYECEDILSAEYPESLEMVQEYLERYHDALVGGGLLAILDTQLVVWESCRFQVELAYLEKAIGRFMVSWRRLARIYGVEDLSHELHERRIAALLERSRASRPPAQSPWNIMSIY